MIRGIAFSTLIVLSYFVKAFLVRVFYSSLITMSKVTPATVSELRQALSSVNAINVATKETVPLSQVMIAGLSVKALEFAYQPIGSHTNRQWGLRPSKIHFVF